MLELRFLLFLGGVGRNDRRKHLRLKGSLSGELPKVVDAGIARNLVNPGPERRPGAITLSVFKDAEKDLLNEVFAERAVARQLGIKVEERRLVAVKQHA